MKSPLLQLPGAVQADAPDDGVAWHYGEPSQEQRALAQGTGFTDRSNRGVIRIEGPDRLRWLHSMLTQHLEGLRPHEPTESLILSPNGHIEHHLELVDDGEAVWAHVEPGTTPALVEFLEKMKFMLRVEVADVTESYAVVNGAAEGLRVLRGDVLVPRAELAVPDGLRPAGLWAYDLNKGCYRGQETVARVHNLGRPPRRLVFLHLDGSVDHLPVHGDPVELDGRQVGFVGSAARHHELGPIGLALVKRNVPVEAGLLAGGVAAAQEVVVDPDAGIHVQVDVRRHRA